jgi:hypothetical protein
MARQAAMAGEPIAPDDRSCPFSHQAEGRKERLLFGKRSKNFRSFGDQGVAASID